MISAPPPPSGRPFVRVVDLETTGSRPPAHGVCEVGWQDVEQDGEDRWIVSESRGSTLIDPRREIPAVTQAIHHIVDDDVHGAPVWEEVAPVVLRPKGCIALAAHRAAFEQRFCTPRLSGGAAWICTWKGALRLFPGSPSFSNQVLRYWRKPEGLDRDLGLPAHRALPDAYVTAHHLRDMLALVPAETLIAWERLPGLPPRVPYGADKGTYWHELTDADLARYARDRDEDVRYAANNEQKRRQVGASPPQSGKPVQESFL
ncbi:3'-5' exonuclease [Parvularcula dongshanensis]|uniref:Exodeoxyribonuclease X n=1 Tax=Parvularcula dongshanensis TaxID=1173995 RepID=A0A840I348_9PROT|nr:3'-5' exonuclease [Parvularcula dongshanensis]MBB4658608.1 exodeoxyribonuclease X [Parvularcula dongshanensis]